MLLNQQLIQDNLQKINERLALAAGRAGRRPSEIQIIAVTKNFPESAIRLAYRAGLWSFGENRVQEALPKIESLKDCPEIKWHMIGHLQSNKARKAVENFALIQSVDSPGLAQRIAAIARENKRSVEILLEVNVSGEPAKSGVLPKAIDPVFEEICSLSEIKLRGLMAVGPLTDNEKTIHGAFKLLKDKFDKLAASGDRADFNILSMGMTDDFEIAVEEGSNMVRIGRGIFGAREKR